MQGDRLGCSEPKPSRSDSSHKVESHHKQPYAHSLISPPPPPLSCQYKSQACNGKVFVTKTGRPATFSAYGGPEGQVIHEDLYMDGVSVQVIDTVLLPGEDGTPGCLDLFNSQAQEDPPAPAEPKPTPKPAQPKPAQPKPKPAQPKPVQPKPAQPQTKPAQPKPAGPKPAQPKPAQPKPDNPDPTEPEPAQPDPAQPDPAQPEEDTPDTSQPARGGLLSRLKGWIGKLPWKQQAIAVRAKRGL